MLDGRAVRRIGGRWGPPAVLAVLGAWQVVGGSSGVLGPPLVVAAASVVAALLLAARLQRPLLVLVLIAAVLLPPALIWGPSQLGAQVLTVAVAVFACGRYGCRPWAWVAAPFASGLVLLQVALDPTQDVGGTAVWALNTIWIFGMGAWLRQKESLVEHTRAEAAERARAEAAEHRLQVARELHDVLAHSLSVMVVQAEVADELLDQDREAARRAVGHIEATGRSALGETRGLLSALRADGSGETGREDRPTSPDVGDVPDLVQRLRSSGLPVVLETAAVDPEDLDGGLPAPLSQAAFRLVQEALTNTMRHAGCVPTTVRLGRSGNCLELVVRNGPPNGSVPPSPVGAEGGGHGLIGMRERVEALGGRLDSGPTVDGGFHLAAVLPLNEAAPA